MVAVFRFVRKARFSGLSDGRSEVLLQAVGWTAPSGVWRTQLRSSARDAISLGRRSKKEHIHTMKEVVRARFLPTSMR